MKASVKWINRYLDGEDLSVTQVEEFLTHAGFPIDARQDLPGGDALLEVEVTSNRGDCLSHVGLAREISARTGMPLKLPVIPELKEAGDVNDAMSLRNTVPEACPRFTARVIRNVRIGPSPRWLADSLVSVGQRPINNVVDITNFINFELGNPCHVFDLARLAGRSLIVRFARDGEALTTLDGKKRTLKPDEVVVADGERAQSLAGVIGGGESEVSAGTSDVVLEMATWDPIAIRRAARRHQLKTDASHRFERYVDARTIDFAARRAAAMIAELAQGTLCGGALDAASGAHAPLREIALRPRRCRAILGVEVPDTEIVRHLSRLHIEVRPVGADGLVHCRIPPFRPDLEREIDLIEEVGRVKGLDAIPIHDRVSVQVRAPQDSERAVRALGAALNAMGFNETVTFSFVTPAHAAAFLPPGQSLLAVDDERRTSDGTLRPSVIASLLECRKKNQDGGVDVTGGVRLYETAAVFSQSPAGTHERRVVALLMDVPGVSKGKPGSTEERQRAVRILRGAAEAICTTLGGADAALEFKTAAAPFPGVDSSACAQVLLRGAPIGWLGLVEPATQRAFDLAVPVAAAELDLGPLAALFPPRSRVRPLPAFPGIERDLSLVVDEAVTWGAVRDLVRSAGLDRLEDVDFVGSYRGKQLGPGKKSLTLRLRFRDPARTLRHEEVDPQVGRVVELAGSQLAATVRA